MKPTARILDAAANRAAEALRVMEDAARFLLDHAELSRELKQLRHDLRAGLPAASPARDTPGDVGTAISTESEAARADTRAVVTAACKRLQESLRSLEEWSKPGAAGTPSAFEPLRYRAYDLESRLLAALPPSFTGWSLCVLLTESNCSRRWTDVAAAAIDGGADCLQLREPDLDSAELLARARALVALAGDRADVIVNDRADIALAAGARGVHVGQRDLGVREVRAIAGDRLLIGVSTADLTQARAARAAGADYCGVGPMFVSTTKPKPALSGPEYLAAYAAERPALPPALAISGINPETIPALRTAAAGTPFGVAVSSAVCAADDPAASCRAILDALHSNTAQPR